MGVGLRDWGQPRELPGEVNKALLQARQLGSVQRPCCKGEVPHNFYGWLLNEHRSRLSALRDVLSQATGMGLTEGLLSAASGLCTPPMVSPLPSLDLPLVLSFCHN